MISMKIYIYPISGRERKNIFAPASTTHTYVRGNFISRTPPYIYRNLKFPRGISRQFKNLYSRLPVKYCVLIFFSTFVPGLRVYPGSTIQRNHNYRFLTDNPYRFSSNFKYCFCVCHTAARCPLEAILFFHFFFTLMDFYSVCIRFLRGSIRDVRDFCRDFLKK